MDKDKMKIIIQEWLKLAEEIDVLDAKRKEFNKVIKEKRTILERKQKEMSEPILLLMNKIDTESIKISDRLTLKSEPVTKTTGLTKPYIKERISQYYDSSRNTFGVLLSDFAQRQKLEITYPEILTFLNKSTLNYKTILTNFMDEYKMYATEEEVMDFLTDHLNNETESLYKYIVDISARKEFLEEEVLTLNKKRDKKSKT